MGEESFKDEVAHRLNKLEQEVDKLRDVLTDLDNTISERIAFALSFERFITLNIGESLRKEAEEVREYGRKKGLSFVEAREEMKRKDILPPFTKEFYNYIDHVKDYIREIYPAD
jgi:hypothetical protein